MLLRTLLLLLTMVWLPYAQSNEIVACIDDHPPYQVLAEKPYGLHISALEVLSDVLNKELIFITSPNFARCIALLKTGDVDVVTGVYPSAERDKFIFYAPFKSADALRVVSRDGITINQYSDFQDKIIGVARGTAYFPRFDKDTSLNKIPIQNVRVGFTLLEKGRIDLLMAGPATIKNLATEIDEADLNVSTMELEDMTNQETPFGFSKNHKLSLSTQEILERVRTAYESGKFNQRKVN